MEDIEEIKANDGLQAQAPTEFIDRSAFDDEPEGQIRGSDQVAEAGDRMMIDTSTVPKKAEVSQSAKPKKGAKAKAGTKRKRKGDDDSQEYDSEVE